MIPAATTTISLLDPELASLPTHKYQLSPLSFRPLLYLVNCLLHLDCKQAFDDLVKLECLKGFSHFGSTYETPRPLSTAKDAEDALVEFNSQTSQICNPSCSKAFDEKLKNVGVKCKDDKVIVADNANAYFRGMYVLRCATLEGHAGYCSNNFHNFTKETLKNNLVMTAAVLLRDSKNIPSDPQLQAYHKDVANADMRELCLPCSRFILSQTPLLAEKSQSLYNFSQNSLAALMGNFAKFKLYETLNTKCERPDFLDRGNITYVLDKTSPYIVPNGGNSLIHGGNIVMTAVVAFVFAMMLM
ncbi:hypothetical protein RI367_006765 [Sorochytrium milnesiophthora]